MYPPALASILQKNNISIGDKVRIQRGTEAWEGILMPRPYDKPVWVIKLANGYNIGIRAEGSAIQLLEKSKVPVPKSPMPFARGDIAILGCGGTIASKVEYKTGAVYPAIDPDELRASFPDLEKLAAIHTRQLFSIFSEDMSPSHWQLIARACAEEIKAGAKGIVLMHGTDTLSYTSAALSFMLQDLPVPVVLVGSQRSSDRPSSENESNLLNAVYSATQDIAEVGACMHAESSDTHNHLHRGTRVRKMHTSRRDAFRSVNALPLARVDYRQSAFQPLSDYRPRASRPLRLLDSLNTNVAMAYIHPGIRSSIFRAFSECDGLVLIGTGLGHVPTNPFADPNAHSILAEIRQLLASGIPVVMTPQTLYGRLNLNVYTTGRLLKDAGVIGDGCDWLPETAFAKLCWALGQTQDPQKVKSLMETNMAGELSERSPLD